VAHPQTLKFPAMDLHQIKQILDLVREHELSEFEIEHDGLRLKIRKDGNGAHVVTHAAPVAPAVAAPAAAAPAAAPDGAGSLAADLADEIELAVVKSPIVGTFYRSSEPGSAAFVEIGSSVKKGDVLCIIEAMKLMNEIDSEYDGEIVNIYVENGQPVQYGERLFAMRTK
jgi:acetyl-CoA carboxylase biotin carboxyl carrier protein